MNVYILLYGQRRPLPKARRLIWFIIWGRLGGWFGSTLVMGYICSGGRFWERLGMGWGSLGDDLGGRLGWVISDLGEDLGVVYLWFISDLGRSPGGPHGQDRVYCVIFSRPLKYLSIGYHLPPPYTVCKNR